MSTRFLLMWVFTLANFSFAGPTFITPTRTQNFFHATRRMDDKLILDADEAINSAFTFFEATCRHVVVLSGKEGNGGRVQWSDVASLGPSYDVQLPFTPYAMGLTLGEARYLAVVSKQGPWVLYDRNYRKYFRGPGEVLTPIESVNAMLELENRESNTEIIRFSPDADTLVTLRGNGSLEHYDLQSKTLLGIVENPPPRPQQNSPLVRTWLGMGGDFIKGSDLFASVDTLGRGQIIHLPTHRIVTSFVLPAGKIGAHPWVQAKSYGPYFLTAQATQTDTFQDQIILQAWKLTEEAGKYSVSLVMERKFDGVGRVPAALVGDHQFAYGTREGRVELYDLNTSQLTTIFSSGKSKPISALAASKDGMTIASGEENGTVCLWNSQGLGHQFCLEGHTHRVEALRIAPIGERLLITTYDPKHPNSADARQMFTIP